MNITQDYDIKFFTTSELSLTAALITLGFQLDSIDKSNPDKVIFIFKRVGNLDEVIQSFWNRTLTVEPISFFEGLRYLKSRIYGGG